jgi:hypothetical protein
MCGFKKRKGASLFLDPPLVNGAKRKRRKKVILRGITFLLLCE